MMDRFISGYRNTISNAKYKYNDLVSYGYDDNRDYLVPESAINGVLINIEDDVKKILRLLDGTEKEAIGVDVADVAKTKLKELLYKLY